MVTFAGVASGSEGSAIHVGKGFSESLAGNKGVSILEKVGITKDPSKIIFDTAKLLPNEVFAGDSLEFVIQLTVGPEFTPGPSRLIFDMPGVMGQSRVSMWHNEDHGYINAYVSNPDVTYVKKLWDIEIMDVPTKTKSSWRGMAQRMFILNLSKGLKQGDVIEVRWGDSQTQRGFAVGCKVCTAIPVAEYQQTIHVRYFDDPEAGLPDMGRSFKGYDRPVPVCDVPLSFEVKPRELHHFRLIRKVNSALLLPQDVFWNVTPVEGISNCIEAGEKPTEQASGAYLFKDKNIQVKSKKVPLIDSPPMDNVFEGKNIYWGDVHNHSIFSYDVIERERMELEPQKTYWHARHRQGLDFVGCSDHHQCWDIERNKIGQENWEKTIEAVRNHTKEGEFLAFIGFEFRGPRGDTVLVFNDIPEYAVIDNPQWKDIRDVWKGLKGYDYISIPHFHNGGSLAENIWWENVASGVETVLEVCSCHGSYERPNELEQGLEMIKSVRYDRTTEYLIKSGHKYGLVCNSDDHKGHPGVNGLTAVYAKNLDKKSIFEAYRNRHVYGTTNARIRLLFTGNGRLMGSSIPNTEKKTFLIDVVGEGELKKIDLFKNGQFYKRINPQGIVFKDEITITDPEPASYYCRVTQLNNQVAYSSPIWFEGI